MKSREESGGFGLYKYGYGYWVRMCTAIAMGVLFLSAAAWAWNQVTGISLPSKGHTLAIESRGDAPASFSLGQNLDLLGVNADNQQVVIGSASVTSLADRALVIAKPVMLNDSNLRDTRLVRVAGAAGSEANSALGVSRVTDIPVVQPVYVQAGLAGLIMLTGLWTIFRYVGTKPSSVEFLIATDEEMRKVNWSTRKIIIDSTKVVVAATFLIAGFIFVLDVVMQAGLWKPIVGSGR